jgi:hypothetical protein
MRHNSPHALCFGDIEDGVDHLSKSVLGWSTSEWAAASMFRYEVLYLLPFRICQVCRVSLSRLHSQKGYSTIQLLNRLSEGNRSPITCLCSALNICLGIP